MPDMVLWPTDATDPVAAAELSGTGATLRQIRLPAGRVAARHSHPFEQFLYVLAGAGELERETGSVGLAPGVVIRLRPNDWHSAIFTSDTILIEVNVAQAAPIS